ncbi:ethanolamine utilization protein EutH [Pseudomonas sp.]|uniref:ethanolamine utilization protein EutH n=1 Tax=Pseudomonas sp. TaxID=306 RepID=UPI002B91EA06|nr:ethanolamine utilization protein EutH [Pseudomonas sp.]HUE90512.1 ethanolamine utilization protein EutH [Pseudomonas sp.]
MNDLGNYVIYVLMFFVAVGAIGAIRDQEKGVGAEFMAGLHTIGYLFIPIAAVMASVPYLSIFVSEVLGPVFGMIGADPSMGATSVLSVDMGGYQLAKAISSSPESWIMSSLNGFLLGPHIVFTIPVALVLLAKRDHKYLALGMMAGFVSIPFSLLAILLIINLSGVDIRPDISTTSEASYALYFEPGMVLANMIPLVLFIGLLAIGLRFYTGAMVKGFMIFGKIMDVLIKMILAASIIEYFTGAFSMVFGAWGFDPIIADSQDQFRALEISGYIALMLSGAFPMVYCIQKLCERPIRKLANKWNFSDAGAGGFIGTIANPLVLFRAIPNMPAKDKVVTIAFSVCGAWMFGDSLAYIANFQPTLIVPLMLGKLVGALIGVAFAYWLAVPKALELESEEKAEVA